MTETDLQGVLDAAKSSSLTISTLLPSVLAIYVLTTAFYNLYLHPLSSHPGPLLGRLTKLNDVYHAYIGDKHINFYHLHARYGPVVRFSPNSLSINDPSALKAIYGHGANVQKSETFYHAFRAHPAAISTLLATERVQHARKRRIMGQAFSETAMRDMEMYVLDNVGVWMKGIEEKVEAAREVGRKWSGQIDMGKWNNYLVFGECIMGPLWNVLHNWLTHLPLQTLWAIWSLGGLSALWQQSLRTGMQSVYSAAPRGETMSSARCLSSTK